MSEINESEEFFDRFFDEFNRYTYTKIGGYAAFIQSPNIGKGSEYILQISSEEKPQFMIADNGKFYISKSQINGEWYLTWDFY